MKDIGYLNNYSTRVRKKMAEKYKCSLDEASTLKAAKELNEDPKERESAVASLRQWVEQNKAWLKSPTDTKFLLCFLRNAKFVQLAARKRLVKYWLGRTKNREWFLNVDTLDQTCVSLMKHGHYIPLRKRDKEGRQVIIGRAGSVPMDGKYTADDVMREYNMVLDLVLMDEKVQVNGEVMILDMSDLTLKHQTFYSPGVMRRAMNVWVKAYPLRYKSFHYYNTNPIFEAVFAIISPLMPDKLKKRLHFHEKNLFELYEYIDKSLLPREYLPDEYKGEDIETLNECIDDYINRLQQPEVREHLLRLSSGDFGVNETLKPNDDELFNESFRKLNVE